MLEGFVANIGKGNVEMQAQSSERDNVLSFYQLDMGLPDGPIHAAERLTIRDGVITAVQLIFDARRLGNG